MIEVTVCPVSGIPLSAVARLFRAQQLPWPIVSTNCRCRCEITSLNGSNSGEEDAGKRKNRDKIVSSVISGIAVVIHDPAKSSYGSVIYGANYQALACSCSIYTVVSQQIRAYFQVLGSLFNRSRSGQSTVAKL